MKTIDHKVSHKKKDKYEKNVKGGTNRKDWLQDNPNNMETSEE
jgi:hypothetical protein